MFIYLMNECMFILISARNLIHDKETNSANFTKKLKLIPAEMSDNKRACI